MTVLLLYKEHLKQYAACVIEKVFPKEICQNIIIIYWNKE